MQSSTVALLGGQRQFAMVKAGKIATNQLQTVQPENDGSFSTSDLPTRS
jgi:hypothetical protein